VSGWLGWLDVSTHILSALVHFAGDLNSVETYLEFGSTVPLRVKYCMHA
jgi:hypothetical protein